ncbi:MAG: efflux RND transporter periplasmic adaptor subunit [Acidobacteria bacterium]|nr:efflux RND transporter periplasmic adaptor subunit [Acidobacteriota bacterium]
MDISRGDSIVKQKKIRRIIYGSIVLILVPVITYGLSRLKPAAPSVDDATTWKDSVKRGEMLVERRGLGTLIPEEIRWIPSTTQGRVEKRLVLPGAHVTPDTILVELSNPELEQQASDAELNLKAALADYENLRVTINNEVMNQQAVAAQVASDFKQATLQAEVDRQLNAEGLSPLLTVKLSTERANNLAVRNELEKKRLAIREESDKARLTSQRVVVDQRKAVFELRKRQLDELKVKAGVHGVLQVLAVEVGQQVAPGTNLVRVADPTKLKAEIRIAETQAKDVQIGQKATVDTRNGIIPGHVTRIDPAAVNGTRVVDIALDGALPQGAVPDLSVDGTIEIERVKDILYVGRPVNGQPNSTVGLFKLEDNGTYANRIQVKLGRASVNTIEVVDGLKVGDKVILSDMSAQDGQDRIRLKM